MRYTEDEFLPLSALQHLAFCERQCALIHLEQVWEDNALTVLGGHVHQKVHGGSPETRRDVRMVRGLRIRSGKLGLTGIADLVEFHRASAGGCRLPERKGRWRPFPVEYKRGRPKAQDWDRVQLCAQAICLEEMLDEPVLEGALFYGETRRRVTVTLDTALRDRTETLSERLHVLVRSGHTPPPPAGALCRSCSLRGPCAPDAVQQVSSVKTWIAARIEDAFRESE